MSVGNRFAGRRYNQIVSFTKKMSNFSHSQHEAKKSTFIKCGKIFENSTRDFKTETGKNQRRENLDD